ncbi:MAG: hypothetical protein SGI90_13570 [Candidatus Eisenbacteria bacterium]|nr:hypothetical protein [Candidatus Eisenbacteria bacterium]
MRVVTMNRTIAATLAAATLLSATSIVGASTIPMPAGARSWILVSGGDCDDDGPNINVDRGHCIGAVSQLLPAGDIGHGQLGGNYSITADAMVGPETIRGAAATFGNFAFAFLDISMIDTYTVSSKTLPNGTVVPVTVTFDAEAVLTPNPVASSFGGGVFGIRIGSGMNTAPIVIPENTRVFGDLGPAASSQIFLGIPQPNSTPQPLHLTATYSFNATIGTPFDLAYYLAARPGGSIIDFHNTASIGFTLPPGTAITSTGGYGNTTPVAPVTWSGLKSRLH